MLQLFACFFHCLAQLSFLTSSVQQVSSNLAWSSRCRRSIRRREGEQVQPLLQRRRRHSRRSTAVVEPSAAAGSTAAPLLHALWEALAAAPAGAP